MFENVLNESMLKIAQKKKKIKIKVHNLRDWTRDSHKTADDKPYGGGSGMVIKLEPIYRAVESLLGNRNIKKLKNKKSIGRDIKVVLLTPQGKRFDQKLAKKLSGFKRLVLIAGHYEGFDERIRSLATDEISIGDYVLTGGELPAMVIVDSVTRLIPGVLGDEESLKHESFENNLLEYPQYTRPREFEGLKVPEVLLNGDHKRIEKWRKEMSLAKTNKKRKDLMREETKHE